MALTDRWQWHASNFYTVDTPFVNVKRPSVKSHSELLNITPVHHINQSYWHFSITLSVPCIRHIWQSSNLHVLFWCILCLSLSDVWLFHFVYFVFNSSNKKSPKTRATPHHLEPSSPFLPRFRYFYYFYLENSQFHTQYNETLEDKQMQY